MMTDNTRKNKVLITVPDLSKPGGVASLYNILALDRIEGVTYFNIHGSTPKNGLGRYGQLLSCFATFFRKLAASDIIHINPSLDKKSFLRDGVFAFLSRSVKGRKTLIYWHGWKDEFEAEIRKSRARLYFFRKTFGKADMHIVLGTVFAEKLTRMGVSSDRIRKESNAADDTFISPAYRKAYDAAAPFCLLFLARIEESKGIYIAIDAIRLLSSQFEIRLTIAGSGSEEAKAREYVKALNLDHLITFTGFIGKDKKDAVLREADLLLLPSWHGEGMPISILEGMLYGLPVVSRPIGGIPDWVTEGENGFLIGGLEAEQFADVIAGLIRDPQRYRYISERNREKALAQFTPEAVRKRLFDYYNELSGARGSVIAKQAEAADHQPLYQD